MSETAWGPSAPNPPTRALRPWTPTPFSLRRQRKEGKRKAAPHCARPFGLAGQTGSLRCSEPGGRAELAALAFGSLRSNRLREARTRCALRALPRVPALLGGAEGVSTANSQQPNLGSRPAVNELTTGCSVFGCSVFGCPTPLCAAEEHSEPARAPKARIPSGSASLFERSERSERKRVLAGAGLRAPQGTLLAEGRKGERSVGPPFFSPLFFGGAKKRGSGSRGEAPWAGVWGPQAPKGCHTGTPNSCSC